MTITANETTPRQARRTTRLDARYALWSLSTLDRVRACGRFVADNDAGATVRVSGSVADGTRTAGLGGVQSCGSVWACPVCAEKIQAHRQAEVASALAVARLRGWEVLFLTLTMRHDSSHSLKRMWEHLSTAWRATTSGSHGLPYIGKRGKMCAGSKGGAWKADKEEFGIQGYLRLIEVTHGENGWHVHAHVLLFCDPAAATITTKTAQDPEQLSMFPQVSGYALTDDDVQALGVRMFLRWRDALNFKGIRPSLRRGVDIRRVRSDDVIAEYFAKNVYTRKGEGSTAHDVTGSHGKAAKNGNRTPFGILAALVDVHTGELGPDYERDLDLWETFERASKGRRQLLWSRGLRADLLAGTDELDDQAVVDEAPGGDTVEYITAPEYRHITSRLLLDQLLRAAEEDDTGEAVAAFLNLRVKPTLPDL